MPSYVITLSTLSPTSRTICTPVPQAQEAPISTRLLDWTGLTFTTLPQQPSLEVDVHTYIHSYTTLQRHGVICGLDPSMLR